MGIESGPKFDPKEKTPALENRVEENTDYESEDMLELATRILQEAEDIKIKPEDKDEKGNLLVFPEGPTSNLGEQGELYWKIVRTKSFKDFFGDWQDTSEVVSKVVDKNGEPLVVFRGVWTLRNGEVLDFYDQETYDREYQDDLHSYGPGIYFTPSRRIASHFAGVGGVVFPAFVNARNPKYTNFINDQIREAKQMLRILLPEKLLKVIPKISLKLKKYDSIFGKTHDTILGRISQPKSYTKNPEELYELALYDVKQILLIPSAIQQSTESQPEI